MAEAVLTHGTKTSNPKLELMLFRRDGKNERSRRKLKSEIWMSPLRMFQSALRSEERGDADAPHDADPIPTQLQRGRAPRSAEILKRARVLSPMRC